ncbi:MAG: HAMP domain-containing sensor histidine kinase [Bacteroides sp.]
MRKIEGKLIASVLSILFLLIAFSCTERKEFRVLVIHSYEKSCASYADFNRLIAKEFKNEGVKADIHTIYLDCEMYLDGPELIQMSHLINQEVSWHPDIILVNDDQATYSLLKCNHPLVKQVPIVFAGVNYPNWAQIKQYPNVTGFHDQIDIKANVKMVQYFFGKGMNLISILDETYIDRMIKADVREQLKNTKIIPFLPDSLNFTTPSLREKGYTLFNAIPVRNTDQKTLIWTISQYAYTRCLVQLKRDCTTKNVGNLTPNVYIAAINEDFGYGENVLGGYMTSLPVQVQEEVGAAVHILQGIKPTEIPIRKSRKEYLLDWKVAKFHHISKDAIPTDYQIINMPFKERYSELWTFLIVFCMLFIAAFSGILIFLYRREQKRKRKALSELADEKESLALALEGSDTFAWKDQNGHFHFENAFWETIKVPAHELTAKEFRSYVHPDQYRIFDNNWETRNTPGKKMVQLQVDFNGKGYCWWEFRYSITLLDTGQARTSGLLLNIQNFKDREQELIEARKLAEKAELKQSFIANMSHEIRTPLNAIVGFSNILASDMQLEEEEKLEYVETINRNSDLLLKLVNDILELSRLESGVLSFECTDFLVSELLDNIFLTYQVLIPSYLDFKKEDSEFLVMIHADQDRLTQVISNFINNAVKFTSTGFIKLGAELSESKREIAIFVEDTGKGIPQKEQQMIFSRFYKQDEFAQGAGLGLSICQVIVEKLQGRIELSSELGKGSRFTVVLPVVSIS